MAEEQKTPPSESAASLPEEQFPPTLETLPEALHLLVLPNGGPVYHHRRSLAVLNKQMLELYGGTLTALNVQWKPDNQRAR